LDILKILVVGCGGFVGSSLRYIITTSFVSSKFPFATLSVNLLSAILAGLAFSYFFKINNVYLQLFIISGFLGSLSTYSTFAYESYFLLNKGYLLFILNIALNALGSILLFFISYRFFTFVFNNLSK
jgi:CrcB protein